MYITKFGKLHLESITDGRLAYYKRGFRVMASGKYGSLPIIEYCDLVKACESLFGYQYGKIVKMRINYRCSKPNKRWQADDRNVFFKDLDDAAAAMSLCKS